MKLLVVLLLLVVALAAATLLGIPMAGALAALGWTGRHADMAAGALGMFVISVISYLLNQ